MDASVRRILLAGEDPGERGRSYELASHVSLSIKIQFLFVKNSLAQRL